ncbi:MAG: DNA-3-methyladenine glycosylase [Verrucomicrobiota bacterium]
MCPEAHRHLSRVDPVLRGIIRSAGPCTLSPKPRTPFEALVTAVAHQQLNGTAAETILKRFKSAIPRRRFPTPDDVDRLSDETIRAAGFSRAKLAAIRDLASRARSGALPSRKRLGGMEDEDVIACLTECRGVGRWTAEMFLMFTLGRPDVLPLDDFGIRNGYRLAYGLPEMPTSKELGSFGERWRPFRTTASWYLWRAVDLARQRSTT